MFDGHEQKPERDHSGRIGHCVNDQVIADRIVAPTCEVMKVPPTQAAAALTIDGRANGCASRELFRARYPYGPAFGEFRPTLRTSEHAIAPTLAHQLRELSLQRRDLDRIARLDASR